ncbi:DinB family protein [Fulvivirga sedimenti]|uniref:DinB family protein n=1 Tax=Fulvivirga sedimenti TaxID=2879465 RepID=A0A9X1KZQ6_9BACT|nr:DUF664 domain-containing protein [Fulvivirga sedimenti]MCA6079113.1 DinB family protein [Fulvivirga sedimenti]
MDHLTQIARRNFLKSAAALGAGAILPMTSAVASSPVSAAADDLMVIGPREGYSPQIGTLVSMLGYMRSAVLNFSNGLTQEQLDYLFDDDANSIGAMLLHLAATEKFYQINTFEGREGFNNTEKKMWEAPMSLGDLGRKNIKGHDMDYYVSILTEVRAETLEVLKTKDDDWLMAVDPQWSTAERSINTYWKWFHVCEHESNHGGQIKFLRSRIK